MEESESFLGTGWSFPPEFRKSTGSVQMRSGEDDIRDSLTILLSTRLGERIMQPNYGSNLEDLLFESIDITLSTYVGNLVRTAILYYEPRIDLNRVTIRDDGQYDGLLLIELDYTIRATNTRTNMVYPFYKGEATDM